MWMRAILCLFAIAAASASGGWESGTKYTYEVRGRTLTALHEVANQYVGILTKATLEVVPKSHNQLFAKLNNVQYAKVEKLLPGGWGSYIPDDQLSYEPLPISSKPIEIRLKGGVIEEIVVDDSLQNWEMNMIKGVISQLQMDINGKHLVQSPENMPPTDDNKNGVFKTMEQTVTGRCEVQYDISSFPEYVLQSRPELAPLPELRKDGDFIDVVKSTNYSHCEKRPYYNFGFPGFQRLQLASNQMGEAFARSSVSRAILSGKLDKYTIQSSVTTHKTIISPNLYNNQKGMIVSRMNVTLTKYTKVTEQLNGPETPRRLKDLTYSLTENLKDVGLENQDDVNQNARLDNHAAKRFRSSLKNQRPSDDDNNWSMELQQEYKHKPHFDEPRKTAVVFNSAVEKKLINPVRAAISIAKQIGEDLQNPSAIPEKATLNKFSTLAVIARAMNTKQIQDVVHELYISASHSEPTSHDNLLQRAAWKAWRDAVSQAGTSPALVNIKEWIVKGMVHSMEAGHMLETLSSAARYPDKEYIHYLFRLAEHPQIKKDHTVYTAALFAFTTLLRLAHVNKVAAIDRYPAYIFGQLNPQDETRVDRYIDYYTYRLKKAVEKDDSVKVQTYISILGNIGHPRVLKSFEPYLEGERTVTPFQRKLMLASLYNMNSVSPKLFRAAAYRIYQSASEDPQIRALAAIYVLYTNPSAATIQRMAESTNFEENEHVRSAVKSMVESLANLKAGEDWERIANAKAAAKNVNETRTSIHFSRGWPFSKDLEDMPMTLSPAIFTISKDDSLLPQSLYLRYGKSFNGLKMPSDSLNLMFSSIQNIYENIFNHEESEPLEASENLEHPLWSHNGVANMLGVTNNRSEPIEANLLLGSGVSKRFFAFDNKTIEHLRSAYKHVWTQLQHGEMKFNHSRFFTPEEMVLTIPTPMGLPTTFKLSNPMYYSVRGKVNAMAQSQGEQSDRMSGLKGVSSDVHYVVSSKTKAELSIVTPFDNKRYQAGIEKDMQINIPLHAKIEFDRETNEVRTMLQPTHPEEKTKMLIIRTRPYTSQEDMLKMEPAQQNIIHIRKPTQANFTVGQDMTGMAFDIDFSSERQFMDFADVIRKVQKGQIASALLQTIAEPIQNFELVVSYNPEKSSAKSVNLSAAYEKIKPSEEQQHGEQQREGEQDREQETEKLIKAAQEEKESEWTKNLTGGHSRRQEILKSISKKIKGSTASVVQLTAKFNGKTQAKFVAIAAFAASPVNEKSHAELHFHQSPVNQENAKHIAVHFTSKMSLPPMVNYKKALDAKHRARLDAVVIMRGKDLSLGEQPAVVHIGTDLKQNEELREFVLNSPMAKLCNAQMRQGNNFLPACQNVTITANMMNEYYTHIQYKHIAEELKNATYKAYSFARYLGWEYYSENALNVHNKDNAFYVHTRFAPNSESVNISIAAPTMNSQFNNVRLSPLAAAVSMAHSVYSPTQMVSLRLFRDQFYPSCIVDRKAINTFNNMTYSLDVDASWHVALHTAYQQPARYYSQLHKNATVLVRKVGASEEKELRVILGNSPRLNINVIELTPSGKSVEVKVNNETVRISSHHVSEFRDENNQVFARMYATPERAVRVSAPKHNFEVLYKPSITVISAGNSLRNQVRGLCGTYSSEIATDFTTPKNCIVKKSEHFVASWAVMATGKDAHRQQESQQVPCLSKTYRFANVVTEWDNNSQQDSNENVQDSSMEKPDEYSSETTEMPKPEECSVRSTGVKVVKLNEQICFSLRPLTLCKSHCQATTKMESVEFYCLPKESSTARHYQKMVQRGATPDLGQKAPNKTMKIQVIESCRP